MKLTDQLTDFINPQISEVVLSLQLFFACVRGRTVSDPQRR